ncbi:hypothetical protein ANCCAN_24789 [Ancylostoma caninum]|uniref:Uncharacterized protein n=1 Tax=Ancylostoma caninum TaxID=29170 RepID=A0A368FBK3_ANCCA|nr:hypothetical protein ANCCAN_24789 [Ancylostoma caninum]
MFFGISGAIPVFAMNSFTNQCLPYQEQQQPQQQLPQQSCFYFFGGPGTVPDTALVPQSSSQYGNALDANNLRAELLKEKALREKAESELQQQKRIVADLTDKVQCAYFMMLQMQESYRINLFSELQASAVNGKYSVEGEDRAAGKENAKLAKQLESSNEQDATIAQKEGDVEGFDVNEMYGTKNELLLMALNYDMTSRQSPEGFQSHS